MSSPVSGGSAREILAAMGESGEIYFDRVSQIRMDCWAKGRTALVGDAAACVSLMAGEGTGLAMAEAYVLAGELRNCGYDHGAAFAGYQERMMPFLKGKQTIGGEIRFLICPENGVWHHVPQCCHAILAAPIRGGFPVRPRTP